MNYGADLLYWLRHKSNLKCAEMWYVFGASRFGHTAVGGFLFFCSKNRIHSMTDTDGTRWTKLTILGPSGFRHSVCNFHGKNSAVCCVIFFRNFDRTSDRSVDLALHSSDRGHGFTGRGVTKLQQCSQNSDVEFWCKVSQLVVDLKGKTVPKLFRLIRLQSYFKEVVSFGMVP